MCDAGGRGKVVSCKAAADECRVLAGAAGGASWGACFTRTERPQRKSGVRAAQAYDLLLLRPQAIQLKVCFCFCFCFKTSALLVQYNITWVSVQYHFHTILFFAGLLCIHHQ